MLAIRMTRHGAKKRPFFHIVVADSRSPRDGRFIEKLGTYNPLLPREHAQRITLDKADPNVLHDEIIILDHALTRPWTVTRDHRRSKKPIWTETVCTEENHQVKIGGEYYFIGAGGDLMPTRRNSRRQT